MRFPTPGASSGMVSSAALNQPSPGSRNAGLRSRVSLMAMSMWKPKSHRWIRKQKPIGRNARLLLPAMSIAAPGNGQLWIRIGTTPTLHWTRRWHKRWPATRPSTMRFLPVLRWKLIWLPMNGKRPWPMSGKMPKPSRPGLKRQRENPSEAAVGTESSKQAGVTGTGHRQAGA